MAADRRSGRCFQGCLSPSSDGGETVNYERVTTKGELQKIVTFPGAENDCHHVHAQGRRLAITQT